MRKLCIALSVLTVAALATLSAPANAIDPTRSAGAYNVIEARDANACARACANDGLCMVWVHRATGACELMAVVPASAPDGAYGMAARAPSSMRLRTPVEIQQVAMIADTARAPALAETPPQIAPETLLPETEDTLALLGGPDEETLRPRHGARQ
jgi:hypothetical protein